ncbi:MAG: mechanosensitive ion channel family protein [Litorimonas sp.]
MQDNQTENTRPDVGADGDTGAVTLTPEVALDTLDRWIDGFMALLPNIAIALAIIALFWFIAKFVANTVVKRFENHERPSLGKAIARLAKIAVLVIGFAFALTVIAPSVKLSTLIGSLGVGSVAIGFAFKDILQNWLSGLLILLRQPFKIGDQIEAAGFEGTVEDIQTRATIIRTYNGEHAIVPNSALYTGSVLVKTKTSLSRGEYTIGVSYDADIDAVLDLIVTELKQIEGIADDPAPEAHTWELGESSVNILARWWTSAEKIEQVRIRGVAVRAVKLALDKAGVEIPYPHLVSVKPASGAGESESGSEESSGSEKQKAPS